MEILAAKESIAKVLIKTRIVQLGVCLEQHLRPKKGKTKLDYLEGPHITGVDYKILSIIHTVVALPTVST